MSKQPWLFCEIITQMRQEGSPASSRSRVHPHRSPCVTWMKRNSVLPDRKLIFFFFFLWGWLKDVQGAWTLLGAGLIKAKNSPASLGSLKLLPLSFEELGDP